MDKKGEKVLYREFDDGSLAPWKNKLIAEDERFAELQRTGVLDILDEVKVELKNVLGVAERNGVDLTELLDPYASYSTRIANATNAGPVLRSRSGKSYDPNTEFSIARDKHRRRVKGGTAMLQRMSLDPQFAAQKEIRSRMGRGNFAENKPVLLSQFKDKYGPYLEDLSEKEVGDLFDDVVSRSESDLKEMVPFYHNNPAEAALANIESVYNAAAQASGLKQLLRKQASLNTRNVDHQRVLAEAGEVFDPNNKEQALLGRTMDATADFSRGFYHDMMSRLKVIRRKGDGTGPSDNPINPQPVGTKLSPSGRDDFIDPPPDMDGFDPPPGGGPDGGPPPSPSTPSQGSSADAEAVAEIIRNIPARKKDPGYMSDDEIISRLDALSRMEASSNAGSRELAASARREIETFRPQILNESLRLDIEGGSAVTKVTQADVSKAANELGIGDIGRVSADPLNSPSAKEVELPKKAKARPAKTQPQSGTGTLSQRPTQAANNQLLGAAEETAPQGVFDRPAPRKASADGEWDYDPQEWNKPFQSQTDNKRGGWKKGDWIQSSKKQNKKGNSAEYRRAIPKSTDPSQSPGAGILDGSMTPEEAGRDILYSFFAKNAEGGTLEASDVANLRAVAEALDLRFPDGTDAKAAFNALAEKLNIDTVEGFKDAGIQKTINHVEDLLKKVIDQNKLYADDINKAHAMAKHLGVEVAEDQTNQDLFNALADSVGFKKKDYASQSRARRDTGTLGRPAGVVDNATSQEAKEIADGRKKREVPPGWTELTVNKRMMSIPGIRGRFELGDKIYWNKKQGAESEHLSAYVQTLGERPVRSAPEGGISDVLSNKLKDIAKKTANRDEEIAAGSTKPKYKPRNTPQLKEEVKAHGVPVESRTTYSVAGLIHEAQIRSGIGKLNGKSITIREWSEMVREKANRLLVEGEADSKTPMTIEFLLTGTAEDAMLAERLIRKFPEVRSAVDKTPRQPRRADAPDAAEVAAAQRSAEESVGVLAPPTGDTELGTLGRGAIAGKSEPRQGVVDSEGSTGALSKRSEADATREPLLGADTAAEKAAKAEKSAQRKAATEDTRLFNRGDKILKAVGDPGKQGEFKKVLRDDGSEKEVWVPATIKAKPEDTKGIESVLSDYGITITKLDNGGWHVDGVNVRDSKNNLKYDKSADDIRQASNAIKYIDDGNMPDEINERFQQIGENVGLIYDETYTPKQWVNLIRDKVAESSAESSVSLRQVQLDALRTRSKIHAETRKARKQQQGRESYQKGKDKKEAERVASYGGEAAMKKAKFDHAARMAKPLHLRPGESRMVGKDGKVQPGWHETKFQIHYNTQKGRPDYKASSNVFPIPALEAAGVAHQTARFAENLSQFGLKPGYGDIELADQLIERITKVKALYRDKKAASEAGEKFVYDPQRHLNPPLSNEGNALGGGVWGSNSDVLEKVKEIKDKLVRAGNQPSKQDAGYKGRKKDAGNMRAWANDGFHANLKNPVNATGRNSGVMLRMLHDMELPEWAEKAFDSLRRQEPHDADIIDAIYQNKEAIEHAAARKHWFNIRQYTAPDGKFNMQVHGDSVKELEGWSAADYAEYTRPDVYDKFHGDRVGAWDDEGYQWKKMSVPDRIKWAKENGMKTHFDGFLIPDEAPTVNVGDPKFDRVTSFPDKNTPTRAEQAAADSLPEIPLHSLVRVKGFDNPAFISRVNWSESQGKNLYYYSYVVDKDEPLRQSNRPVSASDLELSEHRLEIPEDDAVAAMNAVDEVRRLGNEQASQARKARELDKKAKSTPLSQASQSTGVLGRPQAAPTQATRSVVDDANAAFDSVDGDDVGTGALGRSSLTRPPTTTEVIDDAVAGMGGATPSEVASARQAKPGEIEEKFANLAKSPETVVEEPVVPEASAKYVDSEGNLVDEAIKGTAKKEMVKEAQALNAELDVLKKDRIAGNVKAVTGIASANKAALAKKIENLRADIANQKFQANALKEEKARRSKESFYSTDEDGPITQREMADQDLDDYDDYLSSTGYYGQGDPLDDMEDVPEDIAAQWLEEQRKSGLLSSNINYVPSDNSIDLATRRSLPDQLTTNGFKPLKNWDSSATPPKAGSKVFLDGTKQVGEVMPYFESDGVTDYVAVKVPGVGIKQYDVEKLTPYIDPEAGVGEVRGMKGKRTSDKVVEQGNKKSVMKDQGVGEFDGEANKTAGNPDDPDELLGDPGESFAQELLSDGNLPYRQDSSHYALAASRIGVSEGSEFARMVDVGMRGYVPTLGSASQDLASIVEELKPPHQTLLGFLSSGRPELRNMMLQLRESGYLGNVYQAAKRHDDAIRSVNLSAIDDTSVESVSHLLKNSGSQITADQLRIAVESGEFVEMLEKEASRLAAEGRDMAADAVMGEARPLMTRDGKFLGSTYYEDYVNPEAVARLAEKLSDNSYAREMGYTNIVDAFRADVDVASPISGLNDTKGVFSLLVSELRQKVDMSSNDAIQFNATKGATDEFYETLADINEEFVAANGSMLSPVKDRTSKLLSTMRDEEFYGTDSLDSLGLTAEEMEYIGLIGEETAMFGDGTQGVMRTKGEIEDHLHENLPDITSVNRGSSGKVPYISKTVPGGNPNYWDILVKDTSLDGTQRVASHARANSYTDLNGKQMLRIQLDNSHAVRETERAYRADVILNKYGIDPALKENPGELYRLVSQMQENASLSRQQVNELKFAVELSYADSGSVKPRLSSEITAVRAAMNSAAASRYDGISFAEGTSDELLQWADNYWASIGGEGSVVDRIMPEMVSPERMKLHSSGKNNWLAGQTHDGMPVEIIWSDNTKGYTVVVDELNVKSSDLKTIAEAKDAAAKAINESADSAGTSAKAFRFNDATREATGGSTFYQSVEGNKRKAAKIQYPAGDKEQWMKSNFMTYIVAFDSADPLSFVHEIGHLWRHSMREVEPSMLKRAEELLGVPNSDWEGTQVFNPVLGKETNAEEAFADLFMDWMRGGGKKADEGMSGMFEKMKAFVKSSYDSIRGTDTEKALTPEMHQFFDDLLGEAKYFGDGRNTLLDVLDKLKYSSPRAIENYMDGMDPNQLVMAEELVLQSRLRKSLNIELEKLRSQGNEVPEASVPNINSAMEDLKRQMEAMKADGTKMKSSIEVSTGNPNIKLSVNPQVSDKHKLAQFSVPDVVRKDLERAYKTSEELADNALVAWYDSFTNVFKSNVTAVWPGFHMRNLLSGVAQNALNDVFDPTQKGLKKWTKPYMDAGSLLVGDTLDDLNTISAFRDMSPEQATDELRKLAFMHGVFDSPGQHRDLYGIGRSPTEGIPGLRKQEGDTLKQKMWNYIKENSRDMGAEASEPKGMEKLSRKWGFWNVAGGTKAVDTFAPARVGRSAGDIIEGSHRLGGFIAMLKQGIDPAEAAKRVRSLHVDYADLTKSERKYLRRVFPFYSFSKGMSKYLANELYTRPGGRVAQTIRAQNVSRERDVTTPEYVSQGVSIPIGTGSDGSRNFITGLGLMHESAVGLASPFAAGNVQKGLFELGSNLNPAIKGIVETGTNRSLFQESPQGGRSLDDMDPPLGRTLSNLSNFVGLSDSKEPVSTPKLLESIISNSPVSRVLSTTKQLTDSRKGITARLANTMTGLKISSVSPAEQDRVLRERAAELMRDLGGRTFERAYIPEDELAKLSPADREKAEMYMTLMKQLADRAKQRKALREMQQQQ
ncbi:hypothetical protein OAF30_03565 [Flavobacteriales bacterium]|nr:hypothetical protein [Flavobacteriales bacterium]